MLADRTVSFDRRASCCFGHPHGLTTVVVRTKLNSVTTEAAPTRYMRDRAHSARISAPLRPFAWPAPDATEDEATHLRRALLERDEPSAALVRAIREDRTVTLAQFRLALHEGIDAVVDALRAAGATVATGRFGSHMEVGLVNDGPVTLVLDV